jgi:hypothetical protein
MKHAILTISTLLLLAACDAPQSTRLVTAASTGNAVTAPTTNLTDTTVTTPTATAEAGFETCDYSKIGTSSSLGTYGVCQSTLDETIVKVKASVSDSTVRTCLIATYKDSSGSSLYLSITPQCFYPSAGTAVKGRLYKDRSGFEGYSLNGMIIIKERSSSSASTTDALLGYYSCMDAYVNYKSVVCPYGYQQSTYCATLANAYRTNVCTSFKSTFSTSYIDIRLK